MTPEVRAKVFEPFFTTKDVGKGSGLGLSQVLGFAKQSGGGVRIESVRSRGIAIHIYLPRAATAAKREAVIVAPPVPADNLGARILLVDDDNAVRAVIADMLREIGYRVLEAGSGGAALERIDSEPGIDLVVIDFAMPGMSGAELAERLRVKRPALPTLFITGYADHTALGGVSEAHIITNPFVTGALAEKVRRALAETVAAGT
jgi:CheY-like chemotaxis protein